MQAGREAAAAVGLQCRCRHGAGTSAARARGAYDSLPVTQADWRGPVPGRTQAFACHEKTQRVLRCRGPAGYCIPWTDSCHWTGSCTFATRSSQLESYIFSFESITGKLQSVLLPACDGWTACRSTVLPSILPHFSTAQHTLHALIFPSSSHIFTMGFHMPAVACSYQPAC